MHEKHEHDKKTGIITVVTYPEYCCFTVML